MSPALRSWLAGLLTCLSWLTEHITDGLDTLADHIAHDHDDEAGWLVVFVGDHRHHIPTRDAIDHDRDDTCPCGPTTRLTQTDDGDIWTITHHRLTPAPEETRP